MSSYLTTLVKCNQTERTLTPVIAPSSDLPANVQLEVAVADALVSSMFCNSAPAHWTYLLGSEIAKRAVAIYRDSPEFKRFAVSLNSVTVSQAKVFTS